MGDSRERRRASQQVAIDGVRKLDGSTALDSDVELWSKLTAAYGRTDSDAMESALRRGDIDGAILAMLGSPKAENKELRREARCNAISTN